MMVQLGPGFVSQAVNRNKTEMWSILEALRITVITNARQFPREAARGDTSNQVGIFVQLAPKPLR